MSRKDNINKKNPKDSFINSESIDDNNIVFCLSDLKQLFFEKFFKIVFFSILISLFLTFIFIFFLKTPGYEIKASFHEKKAGVETASVKDFFMKSISSQSASATNIMTSRKILKPVIEKLGMQISVAKKKQGFISNQFDYFQEVYFSRKRKPLCDVDDFIFKNVTFLGEAPERFYLKFKNNEQFEVFSFEEKKLISLGEVGKEVNLENEVVFTLQKMAENIDVDHYYLAKVAPLLPLVESYANKVKIETDKFCKDVIQLSLKSRNRHFGALFLNTLMKEYKTFLKRENDKFSKHQLNLISKRIKLLELEFKESLDEYVSYLEKNISSKGFITLDQEMMAVSRPNSNYQNKLYDIDLSLSVLDPINFPNDSNEGGFFPGFDQINTISNQISDLQMQKDNLSLSYVDGGKNISSRLVDTMGKTFLKENETKNDIENLSSTVALSIASKITSLEDKLNNIKEEKNYYLFDNSQTYLPAFSGYKNIFHDLNALKFEQSNLKQIITGIEKGDDRSISLMGIDKASLLENKEDVLSFLKEHKRLLSVKQDLLRKPSYISLSEERTNFDLDTAKRQYVLHLNNLDRVNLEIKELSHTKAKIQLPDFDLSSLSLVLKDPASLSLINKATTLHINTKDIENRSYKDIERDEKELALQKKYLSYHIDELLDLKKINKKMIEKKIENTKAEIIYGINQKISILQNRKKEVIRGKIQSLQTEKSILKEKKQNLKTKMRDFPTRWKYEKMLDLKNDMSLKVIQATTSLFESKTLGNYLHQIQSKPFDKAVPPIYPYKIKFDLVFMGSFLIFSFFIYLFYFVKSLALGFTVTKENLLSSGQKFLGKIKKNEKNNEKNLEIFRKTAFFIDDKKDNKVITFFYNQKGDLENYINKIATLFGHMNKRVALIDLNFSLNKEKSGLLDYLEKKKPALPVIKSEGYDYIPCGLYRPYFQELLLSSNFENTLDMLSSRYDHIFILAPRAIENSESNIYLKYSNSSILTIKREKYKEIKSFIDWHNDNDCRYLAFVAIS